MGAEHPDPRPTELSGELEPTRGVGHGAGEHRLDRRREEIGALEEERPPLREEEGEPGVHVQLRDVGLHLREVWVRGRVERQIGRDAPAYVESGIHLEVAGLDRTGGKRSPQISAARRERGIELDVAARRDAGETGHLVRLAQEAGVVTVAWRRLHPVPVAPGPRPLDDHAPGLLARGFGESERAEGNPDLHGVPVLADPPRRRPDGVPGEVLDPFGGGEERIHLHADRVHAELERTALVVEWIDQDQNVVVARNALEIVPVGVVRPDVLRMGVDRVAGDEQVAAVMRHPAVGLDRRSDIVAGEPLVVERDPGCILPGRLVHPAVEGDLAQRGLDSVRRRPRQGGTRGRCGLCGERGAGEQHEEREPAAAEGVCHTCAEGWPPGRSDATAPSRTGLRDG
jgi:hypothetical protein